MTRALVALLLLLVPWTLSAAVASLRSLEGDVTVLRGGQWIPSDRLADGFLLEPFDTVSTGGNGKADIRLASSTGLDGVIHLDPETTLYVDISPWKKEQTVGVELLVGAVSVFVSSANGASQVEVRTDTGTFGGIGPQFRVVLVPSGDVLVATQAGQTTCRVGGRVVSSDPSSLVEALLLERSVRTIPVNVSTSAAAVQSWALQRNKQFRDHSDGEFKALVSRYLRQAGLFQRAWARVNASGGDDLRTKQVATANLRRVAFPLERSLPRVSSLKRLLTEGVLAPDVELLRNYNAKSFFADDADDALALAARLGEARALYRDLADRNGGDFPSASDGSAVTWDSPFFN